MIKLAIFASGGGSNAKAIINHFEEHDNICVRLIVSNKPKAGVLEHAAEHHIESYIVDKKLLDSDDFIKDMAIRGIDFIILAGFLWKIPDRLILAYPNRILNIHPSLLPKYGGKGMYGMNVHRAVKEHQEETSGMTIHLVNQEYDKGRKLFQDEVALCREDTAEDIAAKVLKLEHKNYPRVIEQYVKTFMS